jgi:ABC-type Fe3+/spermidine/putrescine transport system ATPase subunit
VFNQGRIQQVGAPKSLYERPANRFVADFIGINNLVDGAVQAVDEQHGRLRVQTVLGDLSTLSEQNLRAGERCIVAIRPENMALDGEPAADVNRLPGRISFAAYLGNTLRYDVDLGQGVTFKIDIRDPWHHTQRAMDSAVTVSFPAASTIAIRAE